MEETYEMEATCKNCGTLHITKIPKGTPTFRHKTECPYCGENENCDLTFSYKKIKNG